MTMKILVTGGAGFIGSHVVDAYIEAGHQVVVVDDLSTGRKGNVNPKARFYELDLNDPGLEDVFAQEHPEVVNHHAAQAAVPRSVEDPLYDARVNVLGMIHLLQCCVRYRVRKVIYASTGGALYGDPKTIPVPEDHPVWPKSPYGVSKYAGELYLHAFQAVHGLPYVILRYANVYGPRQDPYGEAGVVAIFAQRMLSGKQPVIYGDGTQTRDFVYVSDVAQANLLALEGGASLVANIGTGQETSVNEIFRLLARCTGFTDEPQYAPARPGEVYRIALDPRRAEQELGWRPQVPLEEGLRRTVESFHHS